MLEDNLLTFQLDYPDGFTETWHPRRGATSASLAGMGIQLLKDAGVNLSLQMVHYPEEDQTIEEISIKEEIPIEDQIHEQDRVITLPHEPDIESVVLSARDAAPLEDVVLDPEEQPV